MLLVILGAGASYDSIPHRPPVQYPPSVLLERLPLANELFADRPEFTRYMESFPECQPIIPFLRHIPEGSSVESVLEALQTEAGEYRATLQQLTAVRFYLLHMLHRCEELWERIAQGITNYKTLVSRIDRWSKTGEQICFVTFNYDTMLEKALPTVGVRIGRIPDYIAHPRYKLIKLHGSVNWAHRVDTPIMNFKERDPVPLFREIIERVADLGINPDFEMKTLPTSGRGLFEKAAYFPAIAIPVQTKLHYECPPDHIDALRVIIPKVTKLLVIGWRAQERNFLDLLRGNPLDGVLLPGLRTLVVAGTQDGASAVAATLQQKMGVKANISFGGFTSFIIKREVDNFLSS